MDTTDGNVKIADLVDYDSQRVSNEITDLTNAIITQAVYDYRKALKWIIRYQDDVTLTGRKRLQSAKRTKRECEQFFKSRWCKMLTGVNMEAVAELIRNGHLEKVYKTEGYAEKKKNDCKTG